MGVGEAKQSTPTLEAATEQLATIAGQQPSVRRARKSIASFKVREGMPVGVAVTLRGARMWEFLDRLITIAVPRIRDFRGLNPRSFDGRGNYSLGVREQLIFPEIDYDSIDEVRGLDVTITTTAATDEEAFELLLALGMPYSKEGPVPRTRPPTRRRSVAARRRACAPRPSRPPSSSSRPRIPRPTRSESEKRNSKKARKAPLRLRARSPRKSKPKARLPTNKGTTDGKDFEDRQARAQA
jgi:large subunit ribosomal protein L5